MTTTSDDNVVTPAAQIGHYDVPTHSEETS